MDEKVKSDIETTIKLRELAIAGRQKTIAANDKMNLDLLRQNEHDQAVIDTLKMQFPEK